MACAPPSRKIFLTPRTSAATNTAGAGCGEVMTTSRTPATWAGNNAHQHRGGQGEASAGNVARHALEGANNLADAHPGRGCHLATRRGSWRRAAARMFRAAMAQRLDKTARHCVVGCANFLGGDGKPGAAEIQVVESLGVANDGAVSLPAHVSRRMRLATSFRSAARRAVPAWSTRSSAS